MAVQEQIYRSGGQGPSGAALPMAGDEAFGAGLGAEIERAGGQLEASQARAMQAEKQRREEDANAQAAVDYAGVVTRVEAKRGELRENAEPDAAGHVAAVGNEIDAESTAFLSTIRDPRVRARWAPQIAELKARVIPDEDGWARGRRLETFKTNVGNAGEEWDKTNFGDPDPHVFEQSIEATRTLIEGLPYGRAVTEPLMKEELGKRASSYFKGLTHSNPVAAAAVLKSGILDHYLTPDQVEKLTNENEVDLRIAAADARRVQEQALQQVHQDVTEFKQRVNDRGEVPADKEFDTLVARATAAGAPEVVDDLRYMQGKIRVSRETDKWTSADWEHNVNALAAKVAGGHSSADEQMQLRLLTELRPAKEAKFRNDPEGHAAAAGMPVPEVDLANPTPAAIGARKAWARAFARTGGLIEPPYLSKDQLQVYRDRANQGPVGQLEVASELKAAWGDAAPSIVRQIGGEPKADMQIMLGLPERMAQVYRQGREALAKNLVKLDDKAARQVWQDYAAAVPADVRPALFDAARNIAAGWMSEQGKTEPTADFANVFRQALHRAGGMLGSAGDGSATGGFIAGTAITPGCRRT
jgi:hypothetical protein